MNTNSNKIDKAQEAISEVASNLRFSILTSISDTWDMIQEIENLDSCNTLEELEEVMGDLGYYDELPCLEELLEEEGVSSLEEAIEECMVAQENRASK